jgi:hypothetical protein
MNADTGTSIRFVNRLTHHAVTPCVGGAVGASPPLTSAFPRAAG